MTSKTKTTATTTDEKPNTPADECAVNANHNSDSEVEEEETGLISDEEFADLIDAITADADPKHREGTRRLMEGIIGRNRAGEKAERDY